MVWFFYQLFKLVIKYYSYFVIIKVIQVYEDVLEFLVIIICNFNMFRSFVVQVSEYGDIFMYVLRYLKGIDVLNDIVDWSKYDKINLIEFILLMGY